jgi:hypothetical protein
VVTIVLVVRLKRAAERARAVELSRQEAERLDRRLAFFAEANVAWHRRWTTMSPCVIWRA